jgi:hypothetical protein
MCFQRSTRVAAVMTEKYWDPVLGELSSRGVKLKGKRISISRDKTLSRAQQKAAIDKLISQTFTKEEMALKERGISDGGVYYLGSAKIVGQIGKAFAEAILEMEKK